jgi:hypothetical protein
VPQAPGTLVTIPAGPRVRPGDTTDDQIDAAYRTKYRRYAANIVNSILTPQARAATLRLTPHPASS